MRKRTLCMVLVVALLVSMFPMTLFAATDAGSGRSGLVEEKALYRGEIVTKLDGEVTGIEEIFGAGMNLYLKDSLVGSANESNNKEFIPLEEVEPGRYITDEIENGIYGIWYGKDTNEANIKRVQEYHLVIYNQNGSVELPYHSVTYDANGGTWGTLDLKKECHLVNSQVLASVNAPERAGHTFLYWSDEEGNEIYPGEVIGDKITESTVLKAHWEENIDVTIKVSLDHRYGNVINDDPESDNVSLQIIREENGIDVPFEKIELAPTESGENNYTYDEVEYAWSKYEVTLEDVPQGIYKVAVQKDSYELVVTRAGMAHEDQSVQVNLKYNNTLAKLSFSVVVDSIVEDLYPEAVNVNVLYRNEGSDGVVEWTPIPQHADDGAPITVYIESRTGEGTGFFPVLPQNLVYRVDVDSFVMPDGRVVPASGDDLINYASTESQLYTAEVEIESDGKKPEGDNLFGAYFTSFKRGYTQHGEPTITIGIKPYTVTLNATFDGEVNGIRDQRVVTIPNLYKYPDLSQYFAQHDSETVYRFVGWKDSKTGLDASELEGEYLTEDVTYTAIYEEYLKIAGTIYVEGTYQLGDQTVNINDIDRIHEVIVVLQKKIDIQNGDSNDLYYVDVSGYETSISYGNEVGAMGIGDFSFTGLVDDGSEYKIKVLSRNYNALYDNEGDGYNNQIEDYSLEENVVVFSGVGNKDDKQAMLYVRLNHAPDSYNQTMQVDASQISANYRPAGALAVILYRDYNTDQKYNVISQHSVEPYGKSMSLDSNGFGESTGDLVWIRHTNGMLYEYQMKVTEVYEESVSGEGVAYNEATAPFTIVYDDASYYSENKDAQHSALKATLVPKKYEIIFDMDTEATIGGMSDYPVNEDGKYYYAHIWSHEDSITAKPYRAGYVFTGWKSPNENVQIGNDGVTITVDASLAETVTLVAQWEQVGVNLNKSASLNNDGTYTIQLDAYAMNGEDDVLCGDTIVRDILAEGFVFTENTQITVYQVAGSYDSSTGKIDWTDNKQVATLSLNGVNEDSVQSDGPIKITAYNLNSGPHTVDITGFNFGANYINLNEPGYKLVVEITAVEATKDAQCGESTTTNREGSGIWFWNNLLEENEMLNDFYQPTTILEEYIYVVDYGKEFALTDWSFSEGNGAAVMHLDADGMDHFNTPNTQADLTYGTVRFEKGTVVYTPTTMNWNGCDSFYVFGKTGNKTVLEQDSNQNGYLWSKVTVIPANNIYYEDSFLTGTGVGGFEFDGSWETVSGGSSAGTSEKEDVYRDVHGWTAALYEDKIYTEGSAHKAYPDGYSKNTWASAEFTFTGTGVEIYTHTSDSSGMVLAVLSKGQNSIAQLADNMSVSGDYYDVPTVAFKDLDYGTYTVKLNATGVVADISNPEELRFDYYIDGIRIHNPLGKTTNEVVVNGYGPEYGAVFTGVREILLDQGNFNAGMAGQTGAVFIDGDGTDTTEIGTFASYGPKNEVYLSAGQAIVLKVDEGYNYYVGLKSLTGSVVSANVNGDRIELAHTIDLYYEAKPKNGYIVIKNTSNSKALLSITNLRTTNGDVSNTNAGVLSVEPLEAISVMNDFSQRMTEENIDFADDLFKSVRSWINKN